MEKKIITPEIREQLRAPFPDVAYKQHPTKTFLTTLKAMYVTERLNDVFGIGRWTIEIEVIERTPDYVLVQGEFKSCDFDVIVPKQFGGHQTTGKNTEIADGFKSALTDCQSKIASYLEIGIEMFKGNVTVKGKTVSMKKDTPKATKKKTEPLILDNAIKQSLTNAVNQCKTVAEVTKMWNNNAELHTTQFFIDLIKARGTELKGGSDG